MSDAASQCQAATASSMLLLVSPSGRTRTSGSLPASRRPRISIDPYSASTTSSVMTATARPSSHSTTCPIASPNVRQTAIGYAASLTALPLTGVPGCGSGMASMTRNVSLIVCLLRTRGRPSVGGSGSLRYLPSDLGREDSAVLPADVPPEVPELPDTQHRGRHGHVRDDPARIHAGPAGGGTTARRQPAVHGRGRDPGLVHAN